MRKHAFALAACLLTAAAAFAQEQPRPTAAPQPQQGPPPAAAPAKPPGPAATAAPAAPAAPAAQSGLRVISDELFARELKDIGGRSFQLSAFRGRVFVINLWATWCGPCRLEIPELNRLYEDFSGRGVEFVGLTTEDPEEDAEGVREFAEQFGVRYKLGWADRETAVALMAGRNAIPQTFVVAPDGRVANVFRGYGPRLPAMVRAAIEKALGPSPPAETLPPPRP